MDKIYINKLRVPCILGIYESEQHVEQVVELDIEIGTDLKKSAQTNSLFYSVDYAALSEEISFIIRKSEFRLLEVLVDCLAHYILNSSPNGRERTGVRYVKILARKPEAMGLLATPAIEITRDADSLWFELQRKSGLTKVYECDDCTVYNLCESLDLANIEDLDDSAYLMSLGSGNSVNNNSLLASTEIELKEYERFNCSVTGSSLIVLKNNFRDKVGASMETGFALDSQL